MGNWGNDYYLLLGNQELEGVRGIRDLQKSGAPVEFSVQLRWKFWWSSGGISGGAPVDVHVRRLSEDPLRSGAAVS
jgi:hypothetical protein